MVAGTWSDFRRISSRTSRDGEGMAGLLAGWRPHVVSLCGEAEPGCGKLQWKQKAADLNVLVGESARAEALALHQAPTLSAGRPYCRRMPQ